MPSSSMMAPRCLTWRRRSIQSPANATSVCFIFGRRNGTWFDGCSTSKSNMKCCGWRCSGWGKRVLASWRFAGSATSVLRLRNGPRESRISAACSAVWSVDFRLYVASRLITSADLERSFGPIYARGLLRRGQSGFAVLGVNPQETQASIDAALTFGILWLDACRLAQAGKMVVEGLKLFLPAGASALTRERMAHLHQEPPSGSSTNWKIVGSI